MSGGSQEQERLRRLRDRQLAARDPHIKERKLQHGIAQRRRKAVQPFSIQRIWSEIPFIWRGSFYGMLVGALALAIVPLFVDSPLAVPCSAASIPILAIFGFFIGRAFDTREELKDLMRRK